MNADCTVMLRNRAISVDESTKRQAVELIHLPEPPVSPVKECLKNNVSMISIIGKLVKVKYPFIITITSK